MAYLGSRIAAVFIGLMLALNYSSAFADERFNTQEIEQLLAPIALYPDSLLSQVLMAATYPLDIVQAARWRAGQSRSLTDQQLSVLIQNQPWDPSVKSVAAFPDVLAMMNEKIDWTSRLGDAFLDQQDDVMDAVQRLRLKAQRAGHLASTHQQRVVVSSSPQVIVIEPAQPEVIYVPVYDPLRVYGAWPYPDYRPYYWYPPSYAASSGIFGFSAGLIVGRALWSSYDWGHRNVYIDVNRYNRYNHTRITSSQWRHKTRYRSDAYRRNDNRPGRGYYTGPSQNSFQGRPGASRPSTRPTRSGDQNRRGGHNAEQRGSRNPGTTGARDRVRDPGSIGTNRVRNNQGGASSPDRARNPGNVATPGRVRDPGSTSRPNRVRDPASAGSPERVRNRGTGYGAQGAPNRARPDAALRERSFGTERSRPQRTGPRMERPRGEASRPNRGGAERQARPQREHRRSDEGQRRQR